MTTRISTPAMLGWTINLLLLIGWLLLTGGVYLVAGLGYSAITGGLLLIALALHVVRLYYNWSFRHVRQPVSPH